MIYFIQETRLPRAECWLSFTENTHQWQQWWYSRHIQAPEMNWDLIWGRKPNYNAEQHRIRERLVTDKKGKCAAYPSLRWAFTSVAQPERRLALLQSNQALQFFFKSRNAYCIQYGDGQINADGFFFFCEIRAEKNCILVQRMWD